MPEKFPSLPKKESIKRSSSEILKIAGEINKLRSKERSGNEIEKRTNILLSLITDGSIAEWRKEEIPSSFEVDSNGLWINIGPEENFGIHSHLPYEKIPPEVAAKMREQQLMMHPPSVYDGEPLESRDADRDQLEVELRIAESRGDAAQISNIARRQCEYVIENMLLEPHAFDAGLTLENYPDRIDSTCDFLLQDSGRVVRGVRYHGLHLPSVMLREFISRPQLPDTEGRESHYFERQPMVRRLDRLVDIAEDLNRGNDEFDAMQTSHRMGRLEENLARLSASTVYSAVSKSVFESRQRRVFGPDNYESAKAIDMLLSTYDREALEKQGMHAARGQFAGGLEFIAFWSAEGYHRVLVDPQKHIRTEQARAAYGSIDAVKRGEFESFEGLMLPYEYFMRAAHMLPYYLGQETETSPASADRIADNISVVKQYLDGMRSIVLTEFDEEIYRHFDAAIQALLSASENDGRAEAIKRFVDVLDDVKQKYRAGFDKSASEIVRERAQPLVAKEVVFDEDFAKNFPKDLLSKEKSYAYALDQELSRSGARIRVLESGEGGIPYALEGRAMRALGLERRPAIIVTGGAKNLQKMGGNEKVSSAAQFILDAAIATRANVLIPGTQSGIGIELARMYQEYIRGKSAEEIAQGPRFFAIEPGKELYYPGNTRLEPGSIYAVTAVDTIATPYHAGWSNHGDESEQRRHNHYRQQFIKRASDGFKAVVITLDGGGWTVLEDNAALHDDFTVMPVEGTGRFATIASEVFKRKEEWAHLQSDDERLGYVDGLVSRMEAGKAREAIEGVLKDERMRRELAEFLREGKDRSVVPTLPEDLTRSLVDILSVGQES